MVNSEIKELLDFEAKRTNMPEFIEADPVQFPRRFTDLRDIEIVSLLVSSIAWGNRKMILANSEKMLRLMDYQPYNFVRERAFADIPDRLNIHRTFFGENLKHFLNGLAVIYEKYPSLDALCDSRQINQAEFPSWELAKTVNEFLCESNSGKTDSRCLPLNTDVTALKRLNMALRWLVRNDGIVDMGVWSSLKPSQLFIPLDVHVANVSRQLGLLTTKGNNRKAAVQLTETLRSMRPEDPVWYDYALFGIGVTGRSKEITIDPRPTA